MATQAPATVVEFQTVVQRDARLTHRWGFDGANNAARLADSKGSAALVQVSYGATPPNVGLGIAGFDKTSMCVETKRTGGYYNPGAGQYGAGAALSTSSVIALGDAMTVEVLFKPTAATLDGPDHCGYIVANYGWAGEWSDVDPALRRGYFLLQRDPDGTPASNGFNVTVGNSFLGDMHTVKSPLAPNHWYFYAGTFVKDGTSSTTINAWIADLTVGENHMSKVLDNEWAGGPFLDAVLGIGVAGNSNDQAFPGLIDEVAIYNAALGDATIQSHLGAILAPEPSAVTLLLAGAMWPLLCAWRRKRRWKVVAGTVCLCLALSVGTSTLFADDLSNPTQPYPTNDNPTSQIRFNTAAGADAKRRQLVNYIWPGGLPATLPTVTGNVGFPSYELEGITPSLVARVDKLDSYVLGMNFTSYVLRPTNTANVRSPAILMPGHLPYEDHMMLAGTDDTANHLLSAGHPVVLTTMPLCGWNMSHNTATLPGIGQVTIPAAGSAGHNYMFNNSQFAASLGGGGSYRFFLEPTVQIINYLYKGIPAIEGVSMIGRSGGGWTTSMVAAIDPRLTLSIPVCGSAPLYIQNKIGSGADMEQVFTPMYDERINANGTGGGVTTYLEEYALGAYGAGRRQIMVTVPEEPVGLFPTKWATDTIRGASVEGLVTGTLANLGAGQWDQAYDWSQPNHEISPWMIDNVIMPAMAVPEPSPVILLSTGLIGLLAWAWRKRR
jgi:hypothetical protein